MTWWSCAATVALAVWLPGTVRAQSFEAGPQVMAVFGREDAVVAGPVIGLLPTSQLRVAAFVGLGVAEGGLRWRTDLLSHLLIHPTKQTGMGWYAGGGVGMVSGPNRRGVLLVVAGVESRPAGKQGWNAEIGVGGGIRVALGWRWRRMRQP